MKSPMPPRKRPMKRAPLNPVNRKRQTRERARTSGSHAAWIRTLPCVVQGDDCRGKVEAAHTETGGGSRKAHRSTLVPACAGHHRTNTVSMHNGVGRFQAMYCINLKASAWNYWKASPHYVEPPLCWRCGSKGYDRWCAECGMARMDVPTSPPPTAQSAAFWKARDAWIAKHGTDVPIPGTDEWPDFEAMVEGVCEP